MRVTGSAGVYPSSRWARARNTAVTGHQYVTGHMFRDCGGGKSHTGAAPYTKFQSEYGLSFICKTTHPRLVGGASTSRYNAHRIVIEEDIRASRN